MDFKDLCHFFEAVKANVGAEKALTIKQFFEKCRETLDREQIFLVLRLVVPKLDRERQSYNMKESRVAKVLVKMLALPSGNDKNILLKSYLMSGQASDFGDVVYSVIRKYLSNCKTILTIDELNSNLDRLVNRRNEMEAEDILIRLFRKCSAEDTKWIIRIVLKDLKLGIHANKILNNYHRDGAAYFCSNSSLKKVCAVLYDQNVNLHELDIEIFEAFRPMLSKRVDGASFIKDFQENKLYYVENKFDGERFQLHMENNCFKYFSRNGFDYTATYGSTHDDGMFTPKLKDLFQPFVKKVILDGEMMLWNRYTKTFGSKGMTFDVKKLKIGGKYQPCFCIYDIILLNENVLTNKPLKQRVSILKKIFKTLILGTVMLSQIREVSTYQEIVNELNSAVEKQEEGIIVKDPNSLYRYSDRVSGWFKMKLEYFQDTMNDLDLILMGGVYASSTSNQLNSFIVGIRSGNTDLGMPLFISFGKVSSGLSDEELEFLNRKLRTEGKLFDNTHGPNLIFGKEVPNYLIEPEKSLIFVVRASELVRSNDNAYKTPYSFRFPRVLKIRDDKPVQDCLDINELLQLCNKNQAVIKLNKRYIELEDITQTKQRTIKRKKVDIPTFTDSRKISDLLENYRIYVQNGDDKMSKEDIEALIRRAGGTITYKLDSTVDIVLAPAYNQKIKELTKHRNNYDIISTDWLQRVLTEGDLVGYETTEIYGLGTSIKNTLSDEFDIFGDSFTQEATVESLKHCFKLMDNLQDVPNFYGMIQVEGVKNFYNFTAYFDKYSIVNDSNSVIIYESFLDEVEFKFYNGRVCSSIMSETNLIIFKQGMNRENIIKQYLVSVGRNNVLVVPSDFIYTKGAD